MIKIDIDKIYIQVGQKVGELEMHFGFNKDFSLPYSYGFLVETVLLDKGNFEQTLIPAQFHTDGSYYKAPIPVFYVQIIEIKQIKQDGFFHERSYVSGLFKAHLKVYNKNYTQSRDVHIEVLEKGSAPLSFMQLSPVVNFLNKYVDNDGEPDKIDIDKVIDEFMIFHMPFQLHKLLSTLKVEFYADSRNRVGKDNYFWTETIITNINENSYFKKLLFLFFNKKYNSCEFSNGVLTACIESEYGWIASHKRRKIEDLSLEIDLRTQIAVWMGEKFNYDEFLFAKCERRSEENGGSPE